MIPSWSFSDMLKLATIPGQRTRPSAVPSSQRYRNVAQLQRQSAEKATVPGVREQLLRSAEKWEFLANSHEANWGQA
jgi:hypothetical protein